MAKYQQEALTLFINTLNLKTENTDFIFLLGSTEQAAAEKNKEINIS